MSSCLTPTVTKTYPTTKVSDNTICTFVPEWQPCNDTSCGTGSAGYDVDDGVTICTNDTLFIARSLVGNNTDAPLAGSASVPPTWELKTLTQWLFS